MRRSDLMEVTESLDPALRPVLLRETFTRGGHTVIKLGDTEIEFNDNFRLYMTTSMSNPHYLPAVYIQVNIINFTVTFEGLQEQLLSAVVRQEKPQLENQRSELLESIAADLQFLRDLEDKSLSLLQKTEEKANKRAGNLLREYLSEKNEDTLFEQYGPGRLNDVLKHFYLDARKPDGEMYKVNSLDSFRYSLNRYLKAPPFLKEFDIMKHEAFNESNQVFKTALTELKANGKGATQHFPIISEIDRTKLYSSTFMQTNSPTGLLNKVQFDIRMYFFRRGAENMDKMTKDTFIVKTDPKTKTKYVTKEMDELTKNHRFNDKENVTAIMPEQPDSPSCPVAAFQKYISKLHPKCNRLWQRPLGSFYEDSASWYCNSPVGRDTLAQFMNKLSKLCSLSQVYTNHSIRATGATILTESRYFADAQIMSVTGHKSVSSLAIYQRTSDKAKFQMGQIIDAAMNGRDPNANALPAPNQQLTLPSPVQPLALPTSARSSTMASTSQVTQMTEFRNQLSGINFNELFSNYDTVPQMPVFHGCYIGSININMNNK
ncbi:KCTD1_15 [Mytilus edulis]|uniref:KCTD1_15 n=1 Tax=Mytilus edulis TaxID=6550 RepID=A0A8S3VNT8_MYTED|nr:KCTD1_15 [Mytilus edulis]